MADIGAPFKQHVLDLEQLKRVANVYYNREADFLRQTAESTARIYKP